METKLIPSSNILVEGANPSWRDDFIELKDRFRKICITGKGTYG